MRPARLDHTFFENEPRSHLGALLLRKGLVTNEELDQALEEKQPGELLGEALVRLQFCFEDDSPACWQAVDVSSWTSA
jgi:hypothetical protein